MSQTKDLQRTFQHVVLVAALMIVVVGSVTAITRSVARTGAVPTSVAAGSGQRGSTRASASSPAMPTWRLPPSTTPSGTVAPPPPHTPAGRPEGGSVYAPAPSPTTSSTPPTSSVVYPCSTSAEQPRCSPATTTATTAPTTGPWSDTVDGIHLTVTLENQRPDAAELLTFDLHVHLDVSANNDWQWAQWGDGSSSPPDGWRSRDPNVTGDDHGACMPAGSDFTLVYHRAYRATGDWTFVIPYGDSPGCKEGSAQHPPPTVRGTIHMGPGPWTHNGPMQPEVYWGGEQCPSSGSGLTVCTQEVSADFDGWVDQMSLDWGDGSPPYQQTVPPPANCEPGTQSPQHADAYPTGGLSSGPPMSHTYPRSGQYTITLSAHSEGCDASEGQSVTWTTSVDVAGG